MMKKTTLLTLLVLLLTTAYGQKRSVPHVPNGGAQYDNQAYLSKKLQQELHGDEIASPATGNGDVVRSQNGGSANKTAAFTVIEAGRATNAFTIINSRTNQVYAVDRPGATNDVMGWIHRHSTLQYGGQPETTANGVVRTDFVSPACPNTAHPQGWQIDIGPMNPIPYPNSARARYPQGVIHVPNGSEDNFADWRLVWSSACTDGNRWGNLNFGVARDLCGIGRGTSSEASEQSRTRATHGWLNNRQDNLTLIPGGLCEGRKGEFWKMDVCFTGPGTGGRYLDSLYLFKGTLNAASNTISWEKYRTFTINIWRERSGANNANFTGYVPGGGNVAFSPDGRWGWANACFDNDEAANEREYDANPHFWYTNDFGVTWNGPIRLPIRQFNEIRDNIRFTFLRAEGSEIVDTSTAIPFQLGDGDLAVDKNGNPHFIVSYANAAKAIPHIDSVRYFQAGGMALFDITTEDNGQTWHAIHMSRVFKRLGTVTGTSNFNFDNYIQAARDAQGEYVFASWVDDTTVSAGTDNMQPDLYTRALRVADIAMTPEDNSLTRGDVNYGRRIYFPTMAPLALTSSGDAGDIFTLPTVFAEVPNGENNETYFNFITDRNVLASEFVLPARDIEISSVAAPLERLCFASETPVTVTLRNAGTAAIGDTFEIAYSVNGGEPVIEEVQLEDSLQPGETINYTFNTVAQIGASGLYTFDIETRLFRDNVFRNHRRTINVTNFGGADQKIFATDELAGCGSLEINTGLEGFQTTWTLDGDPLPATGNSIVLQKSDLPAGSGQLQVSVTNNQCTPSMLTDNVTVRINDIPEMDVPSSSAICQAQAPLRASLTTNAKAEYDYSWQEIGGARSFTTNEISLNTTGRFTARIANRETGCDTSKTVDLRIWNISLSLTAPAQVCEPIALDPENETTGPGVIYTWTVDNDEMYEGPSGAFTTSVDTGGTAAKTYRVSAVDPLGCNAANPATDEVSVATFTKTFDAGGSSRDTLRAELEGNYEVGGTSTQVCCCKNLILRDLSKRGMTPITGRFWTLSGQQGINNDQNIIAAGVKGSPTSPGSDSLVIFIPCTHPRYGNVQFTVNYVIQSGPCSDTIRYQIQMVRPGTMASCPTPDVELFPNLDRDRNVDNPDGWGDCLVSRPDQLNPELGLTVYPNPGAGSYQVELQLEKSGEIQLQLFDLQGRVVWSRTEFGAQQHVSRMDVEHLPTGIYLLKVRTPQGFQTVRIIQQ